VQIPNTLQESPYPAPPDQVPPAPRPVAFNRNARLLRTGVLGGLLLVPNAILAFAWFSGEELRQLEDHGQTTIGRVVNTRVSSSRRSTNYRVDYSYEVSGRAFRSVADVTKQEFGQHRLSAECVVTYLPELPASNCLGRPGPLLDRRTNGFIILAVVAAVGLGFWMLGVETSLRRERFLAREGEATVGRVSERGTTAAKNRTLYWVRHEFTSPSDDLVSSWDYVPPTIWERLTPGTLITLLYDPANPKKHLPLYAFRYAYIANAIEADELND
jgi:hypothetical protein